MQSFIELALGLITQTQIEEAAHISEKTAENLENVGWPQGC